MGKRSQAEATEEFRDFARQRTAALYRSALLLCGDPHGAEDLVQETLAKVYLAWGRRIDNPAAYAQTTLVRVFISSRRPRSSSERPFDALPEAAHHDADASLRIDLIRALGELGAVDRAVLVLRFLEDQSVEHVAGTLGLSPGAVRVRTHRALARLREVLGTDFTFEEALS